MYLRGCVLYLTAEIVLLYLLVQDKSCVLVTTFNFQLYLLTFLIFFILCGT